MFSQTAFLLVFGLGAVCVALGFFLVVRGIGASDSESSVKVIGLELRASRVGPGVLFAMFGVVLIVMALAKQPSEAAPSPAPTPQPAPAPSPKIDPNLPAPQAAPAPAPTDVDMTAPAVDPRVNVEQQRHSREIALIRSFLADAANGGCNPAILGPNPLANCQININQIQATLQQAGPVTNIFFMATVPTAYGAADRFGVQHASGQGLTYTVILGPDGRFAAVGNP
jgi:hypothetical protein